ncbi:MAG TPA: ABC transporter permease [Acidobacteriaceae bacterium]|nr:ABC transporter permease [Acidobacteriaceae bacterium]
MFLRLLLESFLRQRRRRLLAGLAILLGATAITTMLALGTSIGDKINRELNSNYGANIVVYPKADTLDVEVAGVAVKPATNGSYLREADLPKLKNIFWRNNIVGISPELPLTATLNGQRISAVGLWFHHTVSGTGSGNGQSGQSSNDAFTTGAPIVHPWWKLNGAWPDDASPNQAVAGANLAQRAGLHIGDAVTVNDKPVRITGIAATGDDTDNQLLIPLALAQQLTGQSGAVRRVYLSALTKPEDAFARRNPDSLSPRDHDRWYCSPYANSIAYQVDEAIPAAHAEQIRRVAQSEGQILSRISGLMWLVTITSLVAASFAVSSAMATALLERRREIGLMRSLGATQTTIASLFFLETSILAIVTGAIGFVFGSLIAGRIAVQIFGSQIPFNFVLLPVVLALSLLVAIAGSAPSVRLALRLDPATTLREDA